MLSVERITTIEGFIGLGTEWDELLRRSRSDCIFLTHDWLSTWWKHLHEGRRLHVVAVREEGRLVGLLPACVKSPDYARMSPRAVEFLGSGTIGSDYLDAIADAQREDEVLDALAHELATTGLTVQLTQLRRGGCMASLLATKLARRGWSVSDFKANVCPFISLQGQTWETYLASLGGSQRYNFQRRLKNIEKASGFRFERETNLDVVIELHRKRWDSRNASSEAFQTSSIIAFHREFAERARNRGWLRLLSIWLNDQPAAALYGLRYGPTFCFYQSGFDPAFAKHSVGLVMMGLAIRSAIEEGAGEYDLLHGDEEYKFHWTREVRELGRIEIFPPHVRGALYRHCLGLNRAARRMVRRMLIRA